MTRRAGSTGHTGSEIVVVVFDHGVAQRVAASQRRDRAVEAEGVYNLSYLLRPRPVIAIERRTAIQGIGNSESTEVL